MSAEPRTILVVDDNQGLVVLMEKYLRRDGYRTDTATSGATSLAWLAQNRADLLILSLKLVDCRAEDVVRVLEERGQPVPLLVLCGHGEERQAVALMKRGVAVEYLMKDGTLLELLPTVVRQTFEQLDRNTLLREAELAYEHLRKHYEMILHAAGEGICGLDLQGRVTFVNPAGQRMLGFTTEEILGQDLAVFAERPGGEPNGRVRDAIAANTTFRSHDQQFWRKDGTSFPIEYTSTPIREDDRQIGSVFVFKDVTVRRGLEEQVRQSQKLEAVGRLAGGVAHDFNNLLTVVTGYSELLGGNASLDQRAKEAVGEIQKSTERAISVTRQLLAFSRKQLLQPRPVDLNAVIAEINKLLRRLIGEDIALVTQLDPELTAVTSDPGQLEQVVLNLAVNARDAMPRGGTLTITTANVVVDAATARATPGMSAGRFALLTMTDTGVGMDAETRACVFEPFFTTKESGRGTGLGLATVYGIVVQSGGTITVQSDPGRGTTFRILLPQTDQPLRAPAAHSDVVSLGGTETILLVEDEESVRVLAARVLRSYGYEVLEVRDADEALQLAATSGRFLHLLLTDVVMPGSSGVELVRRLSPDRPKMRVLFMSGYADDAIDRHGVLNSDTAFLPKPFAPEALARRVREVLDGKAGR